MHRSQQRSRISFLTYVYDNKKRANLLFGNNPSNRELTDFVINNSLYSEKVLTAMVESFSPYDLSQLFTVADINELPMQCTKDG